MASIALFDGDPKDNAVLAPNGDREPQIWTFTKNPQEFIWSACYYGPKNVATYKRIFSGVSKCELKFQSKNKTQPYLDCR